MIITIYGYGVLINLTIAIITIAILAAIEIQTSKTYIDKENLLFLSILFIAFSVASLFGLIIFLIALFILHKNQKGKSI